MNMYVFMCVHVCVCVLINRCFTLVLFLDSRHDRILGVRCVKGSATGNLKLLFLLFYCLCLCMCMYIRVCVYV
jgi:hypothetical protein